VTHLHVTHGLKVATRATGDMEGSVGAYTRALQVAEPVRVRIVSSRACVC